MSKVPATPKKSIWSRPVSLRRVFSVAVWSFIMMLFIGGVYSFLKSGAETAYESDQMQTAHTLYLALYRYAYDHHGRYPTGKTSTEIFQQLLDQKYISDSDISYFQAEGQIKVEGSKLKFTNLNWDVTNGVSLDDPEGLPLVFSTGYKIDYVPDGKAHPLKNANPLGLVVAYVSGADVYLQPENGVVHIITTSDFEAKGRTYQQLTPQGPLP